MDYAIKAHGRKRKIRQVISSMFHDVETELGRARRIKWHSKVEGAINIYIECTRTLFKLVRTEHEIRTRFATFDKLTRTSV